LSLIWPRRDFELVQYEGNPLPPANKNIARRKIWWGASSRTLAAVLDHIAVGNNPMLTMS
jgi:hypothetical protein